MSYNDNRYSIKVRSGASLDGVANNGALETGCLVRVYDAGTRTESTIYSDKVRTAKTNAITRSQFATDGGIEFYSSASSHDIAVCYSDGTVARFSGVTPNTRTVVLDRSSVDKTLVIPFGASDNTETDTGIDLPYGVKVYDAFIEVETIDATETLDVGLLSSETAGDANGFLAAISVGTLGFVQPNTYTTGSNEIYLSASTLGALLVSKNTGADVAGDTGFVDYQGHFVTGTNAVSVTYTGSSGSDTAAGFIYLRFTHLM